MDLCLDTALWDDVHEAMFKSVKMRVNSCLFCMSIPAMSFQMMIHTVRLV